MLSLAESLPLTTPKSGSHIPVLCDAIVAWIGGREGTRILDATFGGGGHSRAILDSHATTEVVALDQDPQAALRAEALQQQYGQRFRFVSANFDQLANLGLGTFDGAIFDLGLSSFQLDEAERGFSFREDAPCDMRMNPNAHLSAAEFLEVAADVDLIRAIRDYGEEPSWRRVVSRIKEARGSGMLTRTSSLATLIANCVPRQRPGRRVIHPATRSFQGIRIAINDELGALERVLPVIFSALNENGRLAVISFHSLEDRIVKRFFRSMAGRPEHGRDSRTADQRKQQAVLHAAKGIVPASDEIASNPRSRSARLRILEKINPLQNP
jgi:16S rRNA (cytosine1402-N4)-methyltransferase